MNRRLSMYPNEKIEKAIELLIIYDYSIASMSRPGNPYDNAFVESFYRTLKTELIQGRRFLDKEEAERRIFEYIEIYYNRKGCILRWSIRALWITKSDLTAIILTLCTEFCGKTT